MAGGPARTVLVVDDEAMLLRLVDSVLSRAGFRVVTAATSSEALEVFSKDPAAIDVVLIDAGMRPSGAGGVLRSMLALRQGLGVIASSGASPSEELQELLDDYGGLFLSKPFDPAALVSAVSAVGRP